MARIISLFTAESPVLPKILGRINELGKRVKYALENMVSVGTGIPSITSLLELQSLTLDLMNQECQGWGPALHFNRLSRCLWFLLKLESHWLIGAFQSSIYTSHLGDLIRMHSCSGGLRWGGQRASISNRFQVVLMLSTITYRALKGTDAGPSLPHSDLTGLEYRGMGLCKSPLAILMFSQGWELPSRAPASSECHWLCGQARHGSFWSESMHTV